MTAAAVDESTRSDDLASLCVGPVRHAAAVAALTASYRAVPAGHTVRLAKRTSNLFRPRSSTPTVGLDVSGLGGVISVDPVARTADVQGMCTYEKLVDVTLAYGLMPLVVPQLRTITLGGAVTGLGIESTSFRNGLPHESVLELDILTGAGEIVTASPTQNADLFAGFPNSYGSLGYAARLRIELEEIPGYVALRNVRFPDPESLVAAVETIAADGTYDGETVDFVDGVMFDLSELYLVLGRKAATIADAGLARTSDYTGQQIYYRSIRARTRDCLTAYDYLWRWDTDWFWCSGALGAQNPTVRRIWPSRYRRSDVYHKIIALENRYGIAARIDSARGKPARERVVQDVELPSGRTAEFLRWFSANVGMSPVWLCPLRLRRPAGGAPSDAQAQTWPLYPMHQGELYINAGFWGTVAIEPGRADGDVNRAIERSVADFDGHKSLYSDAYYDRETFRALYGGDVYDRLKTTYDPDHRLTGLYEKAVERR